MGKGIDRAVPYKSLEQLKEIKRLGYGFVGRYLSASLWKKLTLKEAKLISDAGLYVVSVYQNSANKAKYFTDKRAIKDAKDALVRAQGVGQPKGTPIYFAVDFDAIGAGAASAVLNYFRKLAPLVIAGGYKVGVYGSYGVCNMIDKYEPKVEFLWQTLAWSRGLKVKYNLYQYKIDTPLPENPKLGYVDLNDSNGNGGGWRVK